MTAEPQPRELRRGWTTGACATAATKAAFGALVGLGFVEPVTIRLPRGGTASFALAEPGVQAGEAWAGVVKDAGDDPDVTHGCLVRAIVRPGAPGSGLTFHAGPGVGTVTRLGLQLPPGEAAINPVPRQMMREAVAEIAAATGAAPDVALTISIPGGEILAEKTLNGRLGIVGGLSILGTTGVVIPYSCAAWIHSIHRGIDVARAAGLAHVAAATGSTSGGRQPSTVCPIWRCSTWAISPVARSKYLRRHPVPHLSVAGGFAKLAKLAQGKLDLHSSRSSLDQAELARFASTHGAASLLVSEILTANTAGQILGQAQAIGFPLADLLAARAQVVSREVLGTGRGGRGVGGGPAGLHCRQGGRLVSRVLILGGTGEAGSLARAIAVSGWSAPILSLAGLTEAAPIEGVIMRSGGFGGPQGLTEYLRATGVAAVIDATHPFAARITEHAMRACVAVGVPRFRLQRATWQLHPGDHWHAVEVDRRWPCMAAAAGAPGVRDARAPCAARAWWASAFTFVMRGITRPPSVPET